MSSDPSDAIRSKKKRDASAGVSTSQRQDPTTLHQNAHRIGANISNHPQQQQPRNRRRLSYPTTHQPPSYSLASRIQPLSVIPSVPNEGNCASSKQPTTEPNMNDIEVEPQQGAASNMNPSDSISNRRQSSRNATTSYIPPQDHHRYETNSTNISSATTSVTTDAQNNKPQHMEESQLYNFIVSLSESCRKHHNSAHVELGNQNAVDDPSQAAFCIPLTKAPTYCQDAIHTLQRILPHIESALRNEMQRIVDTTTTMTTTTNPDSRIYPQQQDLESLRVMTLHMCDFYIDVLEQNGSSGFCPQGPHLLLHAQQILPRVYLLFHCLATHVTASPSLSICEDEESISQLMKICHTIAMLLNRMPSVSLLRVAISDMIYLSKDLSIWHEMRSGAAQGISDIDAGDLSISILEETIEMIDWTKYNTGDDGQESSVNDMAKPEYIIQVQNTPQSIQVLRWYTLVILEKLLTLNKQGRISPTYTMSMITEEIDPTYYFACMGSDPDLFITNQVDVEEIRNLLIPFRQIFLSSTTNKANSHYSFNIVSRLLMQLQSDWNRSCAPNLSLLEEVALLVVHGVRYSLEVLPASQDTLNIGGLIDDTNTDTIENLIQLLSNLVYHPPSVAGSLSLHDVTVRMHQMCYEILLDCLPHILRLSSIGLLEPNCHSHASFTLTTVILRTIIVIQCEISGPSSPWQGDFVRPLFQSLDDPRLSDSVIFILSGIVLERKHGKSIVPDLDDALKNSLPTSLSDRTEPNVQTQDEVQLGSKRQTVQQSLNHVYPQKRFRKGALVPSDFDVFSLHDELLRCFDQNTYDAISRLKTELRTSDSSFTDSWLSDLLYITRRFHLVLLLIQHEEPDTLRNLPALAPSLFRFLNNSLLITSNISKLLMQVEDRQHDSSPHTANVVEHVVMCGIFLEKSVWFETSGYDCLQGFLQSTLFLARRWRIIPTSYEDSNVISSFEVPSYLHDVLFAFAQPRSGLSALVDSPQSACVLNVELFMILSATINAQSLERLRIHWTGPFLTPVTENLQHQAMRLSTLVCPSHRHQINSTTLENMQTQSRGALLRARLDHPDPLHRLILWQISTWMIQSMTPQELHLWSRHRVGSGISFGTRILNFLIDIAFLEANPTVLTYTSRELGNVLSSNNWITAFAILSTDEEWQRAENLGVASTGTINDVMSRFFQYIEDTSNMHGKNTIQINADAIGDKSTAKAIEMFHKSAARTISSLCIAKRYSMNEPTNIANKNSILLAVKAWSRFYQSASRRIELDGLYFAGLLYIAHCSDYGTIVLSEKWSSVAPIIVRELFASSSNRQREFKPDLDDRAQPSWKLRQFSAFSTFIYAVIGGRLGGEAHFSVLVDADLEKYVDSSLPSIIAELVVKKDYFGLQMMASYKLYVLGQKRSLLKILRRFEPLSFHVDPISGFVVGCVSKTSTIRLWNFDLENHTRQLCLAPGLVEQIIPLIFMSSGGDELSFFANIVLQKKISLRQLVTSREMLTLKNFVLALGRNPEHLDPMLVALKKAAMVRSENFNDSNESLLLNHVYTNDDAVKSWITNNFMFLLVNVVQYKWSTKTVTQQVESLTSLLTILHYLESTESSQYLPQIMATVTTALSDESPPLHPYEDASQLKHLRLLAVKVLSEFVKKMAQSQLEVLGQNLTLVIVALIPTLTNVNIKENHLICEEERHGVSLLEWLASQESLFQYFEEIPFLPPTPSLDSVRIRLQARGINFDHLLTLSAEATSAQDGAAGTRSVTSDTGSTGGDSRGAASNALRQAALRRRLEMVSPLIDNDSASVRGVALQHLTSLLQFNRELFHSLIENEGTTSFKKFVTVLYRDNNGKCRWNITDFIHVLLSRCLKESDQNTRTMLATCFGEVGAINANLLEETKASNETHSRKTSIPPWYSAPHLLGLQLVTTHLVAALKSAPSSSDQHKIAFAVQQLLALLNEAGESGIIGGAQNDASLRRLYHATTSIAESTTSKPKMHESLIHILVDAGVIDVVEPFWYSEFHEAEANAPKPFPFFRSSLTYYVWLSNWCRYMIHRANENRETEWTRLFHSCRTALRTSTGLGVADCLLPYLVLDCLCFGSGHDRAMLLSEMRDVLTYDVNGDLKNETMSLADRRNAVSKVFEVVDILQLWIEPEADIRFSRRYQIPSKENSQTARPVLSVGSWRRDESAMRIEDMLNELPLELRGKASFSVGMHANSLRCLEMASRLTVAGNVFGDEVTLQANKHSRSRAAGSCPKEVVALLKDVLASLNDYETITALVDDNVWDSPNERTRDSIRQKEALHDWQGALHDYERAQQLNIDDPSMRTGILKCLLELGHFDSVLQQVTYTKSIYSQKHANDVAGAVPLAVEAAWRLGRWETLSELVEVDTAGFAEPDALYQVHLGKALLCLHRKNRESAILSLTDARSAVLDGLGNVARESYSRSYGHIVKLQAIREIEDVSNMLCSRESTSIGQYTNSSSLSWNRRLGLVSSQGATSIMNTRLVLARLSKDTAFEGSLFLQMGKRARKSGLFVTAGSAFSQAEATFRCLDGNKTAKLKSSLQLQIAKLKYESGESSVALRMLGQEDIETMGVLKKDRLVAKSCKRVLDNLGINERGMDEKEVLNIFVRSALQTTRWMVDGGLKESAEIVARFRIIHCLAPNFEKGHFQFAKYVDSLLQARILALHGRVPDRVTGITDEKLKSLIVSKDKACIRYVVLAVKHYAEALVLDVKHVYQALPRLLSLWFDFTSIPSQRFSSLHSSEKGNSPDLDSFLNASKDEINAFMASTYRKISAQSLYTAIPQLISRIIHDDVDTASVVQAILRRVLTKYPAQAMWPLAWIRQSRDPQRKQIGLDIFSQVTDTLVKSESLHKLLATSSTLIDYLYALAKKEVSDKIKDSMKVRPLSAEVDLCEFVPPIQAALSASLVSGDSSRSRDIFPRHIPRMRAIDDIVGVMTSKARPKKIRVYVVAADSISQIRVGTKNCNVHDIGEIHFLLKQEVKGDLRKDARVQDLNNVINRIMSSMDTTANGVLAQTRRLHLRTFCVTCLSEETGLLEWVPHTASLRAMIAKTYNPQADSIYGKRQGKRITNFTDPQMRTKFENVCQAAFFVSGDLTKAAMLFEKECLSAYPPILYWWYVLQFPDPHAWYEARTRFALSTAAWSAVGHVIGLGDRHSENILLDKTSGECVHVDFDCIFDKGLHLPKPEVVPFRLTQNMVDALGPTGADGMYSWNLKAAMSALRDNRDTLLSVLEPFVKDPVINWKRYRSQQRASYRAADHDPTIEAKQKMSVIDERLRGIYNLKNNNMKKIRRVDMIENQEDDELRHPIPLSVEGQVHKMIAEATSAENLVQLYVGWMPWV